MPGFNLITLRNVACRTVNQIACVPIQWVKLPCMQGLPPKRMSVPSWNACAITLQDLQSPQNVCH